MDHEQLKLRVRAKGRQRYSGAAAERLHHRAHGAATAGVAGANGGGAHRRITGSAATCTALKRLMGHTQTAPMKRAGGAPSMTSAVASDWSWRCVAWQRIRIVRRWGGCGHSASSARRPIALRSSCTVASRAGLSFQPPSRTVREPYQRVFDPFPRRARPLPGVVAGAARGARGGSMQGRSHRHKLREILLPDAVWSAHGDYPRGARGSRPGPDMESPGTRIPVTGSGLNKIITPRVREAGIEKVISPASAAGNLHLAVRSRKESGKTAVVPPSDCAQRPQHRHSA